jgi:TonB family protein
MPVSGMGATDTTFYNSKWKPCARDTASFYRPKPLLVNGIYEVRDYYRSGIPQMVGHYSKLKPEREEGQFTYYDTAGRVVSTGRAHNNLRVGEWKFYWRNRLIEIDVHHPDTSFTFTDYDSFSNNVIRTGAWRNHKRQGEWKYYYSNGQIRYIDNYFNGRFDGCCDERDSNGVVRSEAEYYKGLRHGVSTVYNKFGAPTTVLHFRHGIAEGEVRGYSAGTGALTFLATAHNDTVSGPATYYSPYCATVKASGNMLAFRKEGTWTTYYDCSDRILSTQYFKKDSADGEFILYHKDTKKKIITGQLSANKRIGEWKYYFPGTDTLRQVIHFNEGKLHGELLAWYPTGELRRKEVYDNGTMMHWNCYTRKGTDTIFYSRIEDVSISADPQRYFDKQIVYPEEALRKNLAGKVFVELTVDHEGRILNSAVVRSTDKVFEEEALRVATTIPILSPAIEDGIPVYSQITVPVLFNP